MDIEYYVEKYKEHEARRASTNERNAFWQQYNKQELDSETSFDMGRYSQ